MPWNALGEQGKRRGGAALFRGRGMAVLRRAVLSCIRDSTSWRTSLFSVFL